MKDYGMDHPQRSFLDRHGKCLGAASMKISAIVVLGCIIWAAIIFAPSAIETMQEHSHHVVAESRK